MENVLNEFLKSEKSLYLFAGIIGVASVVVGLLFLLFSTHKSFAITMLVIGVLEIVVIFPSYHNHQKKSDSKILFYENNINGFEELESAKIKKELNSVISPLLNVIESRTTLLFPSSAHRKNISTFLQSCDFSACLRVEKMIVF